MGPPVCEETERTGYDRDAFGTAYTSLSAWRFGRSEHRDVPGRHDSETRGGEVGYHDLR